VTKYTPDSKPGRLLPLHEKVSRIVQSLAKSSSKAQPDLQESAMVEIPEKVVEQAIRTWRERSYYLPGELLSDPAWIMLLELLRAELGQRRLSSTRLLKLSAVSMASAARWLKGLESRELVVRRSDPHEPEKEFFELSPKASLSLRRYFRDVVQGHC
jgi:DNA-binding MarR family transcriptional regulator